MKKLITLILILVCGQAMATDYYFSMASGNDVTGAGTQISPWKSLTKAQTVATTGNRLFFQRGDTWVGTLVMQGSGTSGTRVVLSAYGTGAKPIITGFSNISAWTNLGSNIWESTSAVSTLSTCNIASIGGANYSQGRTPNSGYYTINSTNGTSTIVSSSLNAGTINWTGAQVVMRKYRWIMDKYTVTSASGSTINFTSSGDAVQANYGFFLINDVRTLDVANEWSYNTSTKKMSIYATSTPTNIKVPTVATGIDLNGKNYITIDNIDFQGFNDYGVYGTANDYINITNCNFSFIGNSAGYLYVSGSSSETCIFTGNTLTEIGSMGFHMGYANNSTVSSNTLLRIGRYAGMGQNGDVSYCGIVNWGDNQVTSLNNVKAAGYCGIRFDGNSSLIDKNLVDSTNFVKDDGGGIYVYPQQTGPSSTVTYLTRTVSNNIVLNTLGAIAGGEPTSDHDEGYAIYNDGTSPDVIYSNNTIHNAHCGFFSNAGKRNTLQGNTLYNCKRNIFIINYNNFGLNNWTITGNTSVAKLADQYVLYTEPNAATLPATWTLNNNVYARPIDDTDCIWYDPGGSNVFVTLAQWKAAPYTNGQDAASTKSPKAVTSVDSLRFIYNWSAGAVTTSLGANYIDMVNNAYNGSITLQPYTSKVLIRNGSSSTPPTCTAIPSSTITLPVNSVSLNGVATSTTGGSISSWAWVKTSGPATGTISNASSQIATAVNLVQGTYVFTVTATDNNGLQCTATKTVTVEAALVVCTANAGADQTITLPTSTVALSGSGVGGTINSYLWTIVNGVGGTFSASTSANTNLSGLTAGFYSVRLRVGNVEQQFCYDFVGITVNAAPVAPTCDAGVTPVTITLPVNSVGLTATGSGANSVSFLWSKVSGTGGTITAPTSASTTATGLTQGSYVYRITVTDNVSGLTCTSDKSITVNAAVPLVPPTVNAGVNQSIQLPTNSVTVTSTAVAASGSITGYSWLKVSGGAATITSATSASTTITGLVAGVYLFSVTATQTNGLTATDTVQITVSAANALPATGIKYFQASFWKTQKQVVGGWTSTITDNTLYFQFQKKSRNGSWGKVGANIVPKIGVVDYWGYDFSPTYGKTSSYRIKVFDKTGVTFSEIVNVYVPPKKTGSSIGGNIILE